jgi:hypothetical protein
MKPNWLSDGRLVPDEVMRYLPKIAVHAVEEHHLSLEALQTGSGPRSALRMKPLSTCESTRENRGRASLKGKRIPIFLIVDRALFHCAKAMRQFVCDIAVNSGFFSYRPTVPNSIRTSMCGRR